MAQSAYVSELRNRSSSLSFADGNDCSNLWDEDEVVEMDLFTACSIGQYSCVRQHLADGMEIIDLDQYNCGGWTPLMYAAYVGHDNIVNLLLDSSVDANAQTTKNGATPLMLAASCGNESVVFFLLQNGAKIDVQDRRGWTCLFYATFQGHLNVVKLLLENGADKEIREHTMGLTPLLAAAKEGHEVIFENLLKHNANFRARTNHGQDARSLALTQGNMTVVNIIDLHLFQHQPNYFLRSEPGLVGDDEVSGFLVNAKVHGWLQDRNSIPGTGIRDGPEAFAKLMMDHQNGGEPMNIPTPARKQNRAAHLVESPHHLSVTPNTPEGTVGSFEEHFFINCGRTVESASLHKQLQKVNSLETTGANQHLQLHANGIPTAQPTVASFLEDLKLTKYLSVFEKQDIDFNTLLTLTDSDLKDAGIILFGPRRKIFTAVSRWKEEHRQGNTDGRAFEKLTVQAQQAEVQLMKVSSEIQQLKAQLIQEKDLRLVVESCLMEEKAKRQEIYTRVCTLQEHWKHVGEEVEKLKALSEDMEKRLNLSEDQTKELHDKLENSIVNLDSTLHQGTTATNCILSGHQNEQSGNSSESSGNSSSVQATVSWERLFAARARSSITQQFQIIQSPGVVVSIPVNTKTSNSEENNVVLDLSGRPLAQGLVVQKPINANPRLKGGSKGFAKR